jgi:hypothetical protein
MTIRDNADRNIAVAFVGTDSIARKQANLVRLQRVNVRGQNVSAVGDSVALAEALPSVQQLDLGETLLSSWSQVSEIARALPTVGILDLSGNRLAPLMPDIAPDVGAALVHLRHLFLNNLQISWDSVSVLHRRKIGK